MQSLRSITPVLKAILFALVFAGYGLISAEVSMAGDVAIKGYDTVAYFKDGKAQKGSTAFTHHWHDVTWYFASRKNRDLFAESPEEYAPQYDGYCAWAMTEKRLAVTDPEVWKIVDGKLYLNCSPTAYEKWSKDIPGNIRKADRNWREMQYPH